MGRSRIPKPMLKLQETSPSHEEIFIQRYERLRGWALRLTGNDKEQAEDLLHDAFIHFSLHRTDPNDVRNVDAYLHTMLRNLHLSQARRIARSPQGHLSLVDYDSAESSLQTIDPRATIKVHDELRTICHYACVRKESSKAGSVLILRFFHGYYPGEIAQILGSPRYTADNLLKTARREMKLFQEKPDFLSLIDRDAPNLVSQISFGHVSPDILAELRQAIFQSRRGDCLAVEQLEEFYRSTESAPIESRALGHLVSCSRCLDEANKLLGLPLLAARHATDTMGSNSGPKGGASGGGGGGASSAAAFLRKSRRWAKQVYEHRPQELRISVNGFIIGSQKISSDVSELTLSVNLDERIGFIEVFSESGVRLFFMCVESPPDGAVEQPSKVELSDGRTLDLTLNFSDAWPKLHAVYYDPQLQETAAREAYAQEREGAAAVSQEQHGEDSARFERHGLPVLARLLSRLWHGLTDWKLWLRPGTVTAVLSIILIAALLFVRSPAPPLTAAELLRRSIAAEDATAHRADQVFHRTINLEELDPSAGDVIARRRIEVWHSGERGVTARRVYDEHERLIAGEWRRADGTRTIYQHQARTRPANGAEAVWTLDNIWQLEVSAKDFSALIAHPDDARIEEDSAAYIVAYGGEGTNGLVKATLVLSRVDLHAIQQRLSVRQGQVIHEYRFVENSFEHRPASAVAPAVFDPDPELLSSASTQTRSSLKPVVEDEQASATTEPSRPAVVASAELEVEVTYLLNQIKANLGEQINITRTNEGALLVQGIVETDRRQAEILRALAPVMNNPAVMIKVETVSEAMKRRTQSSSTTVTGQGVEVDENMRIPVDAEVRRYLARRGVGDDRIDENVRQLSSRIMSRARRALRHAWALKHLSQGLTQEEIRTLSASARAKRLSIIQEHAQAIQQETMTLRQELEAIFNTSSGGAEDSTLINSEADLTRALARLIDLCASNDEAIRSAFTISASTSVSTAIKTERFWRSLKSTEQSASRIESAARKLQTSP